MKSQTTLNIHQTIYNHWTFDKMKYKGDMFERRQTKCSIKTWQIIQTFPLLANESFWFTSNNLYEEITDTEIHRL